jgi:hypothetical protein
MRTRNERRDLTERKLKQRERMKNDLGLQGGTLYEKHREKVENSLGYMRDGNVSHYVSCGFGAKTKNKNTEYGARHNYSPHDIRQLDKDNDLFY